MKGQVIVDSLLNSRVRPPSTPSLYFQVAFGQAYHSLLLESTPFLVCRTPRSPGFLPSSLAAHPQSPLWVSPLLPDF